MKNGIKFQVVKPEPKPQPAAKIVKTPKLGKGSDAARKAWQTRRSK